MKDAVVAVMALVAMLIISGIVGAIIGEEYGYESGQIDALSGHVVYCLERQENLTLIWVHHPEGCDEPNP